MSFLPTRPVLFRVLLCLCVAAGAASLVAQRRPASPVFALPVGSHLHGDLEFALHQGQASLTFTAAGSRYQHDCGTAPVAGCTALTMDAVFADTLEADGLTDIELDVSGSAQLPVVAFRRQGAAYPFLVLRDAA